MGRPSGQPMATILLGHPTAPGSWSRAAGTSGSMRPTAPAAIGSRPAVHATRPRAGHPMVPASSSDVLRGSKEYIAVVSASGGTVRQLSHRHERPVRWHSARSTSDRAAVRAPWVARRQPRPRAVLRAATARRRPTLPRVDDDADAEPGAPGPAACRHPGRRRSASAAGSPTRRCCTPGPRRAGRAKRHGIHLGGAGHPRPTGRRRRTRVPTRRASS